MARNPESDDVESLMRAPDQPAATLLKSWGRRMEKGSARVVPVFVGGAWSLQVPRGNKRVLRVNVPSKGRGP